MSKIEYQKKLKRVGESLKSMRYTFREVMGLKSQPMRERVTSIIEAKRQPQGQPQTRQGTPQQGAPQIQERFASRPRFLDMILGGEQGQQQQEAPQLREDQVAVLQEYEQQMAEDAEKRAEAKENEEKEVERQKILKRARRKMSFANI